MPIANKAHRLIVILGLVLAAGAGLAHEGATGVVKKRMDLMKAQAKDMKLLSEMAKGKTRFDTGKAAAAARALAEMTASIPTLFPAGSGGHPSEALPAVWTEWDRFTENAKEAQSAAEQLAASLASTPPGNWQPAFKAMTDACKSCHQSFRQKDQAGHRQH